MNGVTDKTREGFKRLLTRFREGRIPIPISNRYPWQSKLATLELLDHARSLGAPVRILTGSGTDSFYGTEVGAALRVCLEKGCLVRVLVWNALDRPCGKALTVLSKRFSQQMQIRSKSGREKESPHFLTVDGEACRLEAPHEPYDDVEFSEIWPETVAQIWFNEPPLTKALNTYFDREWGSCPVGPEPV